MLISNLIFYLLGCATIASIWLVKEMVDGERNDEEALKALDEKIKDGEL